MADRQRHRQRNEAHTPVLWLALCYVALVVVMVVVQMINGNGVSVQARSYVQLIRVAEHLGASSRRPRHPFPALMAFVNPGRVPVYTALPAHPEQASQDLLDPLNRNIDHPARTATAKSLWSARQA